ncbi:MAG: hypothetical protein ABI347_06680 [Nitrososphaera sp.]|jgi:hypothetical protein
MAERLAIGRIGIVGAPAEGVICRLRQKPAKAVKYDYLVVSDNIEDASWVDVVTVRDFRRVKEKLKKKARAGLGLEMIVAHARKMDATCAAKWLADVSELYSFCRSAKCQLILSSGADTSYSMVSGQCLDAILQVCGIDPERHWAEMSAWLASRLGRRVKTC